MAAVAARSPRAAATAACSIVPAFPPNDSRLASPPFIPIAALASSQPSQWLLARHLPIVASELPPPPPPPPPLAVAPMSSSHSSRRSLPSTAVEALAASHQQRPVDRRFPATASELPPQPPPPLLAAVLRSRALLGSHRRPSPSSPAISRSSSCATTSRPQPPSCRRHNRRHFSQRCFAAEHSLARIAARPAGGPGRQPSAASARVPPLLDRRLRAADADDTSRSGASQLSNPWLDSPPVLSVALAASHPQQQPMDRRFSIAASELPTPTQPPPLLQLCFAAEQSLAHIAAHPAGGSGRQPSAAAARGPPLPDHSLRAADAAATSRSGASQPSTPWLASPPILPLALAASHQQQQLVCHRFSNAASELPTPTTLLAAVLRS